jgi:two-component system nitrogen regulation sensor histidine kinase NtrY
VVSAFLSALVSFAILLGLTPIEPVDQVVLGAVVVNLVFVIGLVTLVFLEIRIAASARGVGERRRPNCTSGWSALFSIVAIRSRYPGGHRRLDHPRCRARSLVFFPHKVDRQFIALGGCRPMCLENARFLQGQTVSMANDLDNARSLYSASTGWGSRSS